MTGFAGTYNLWWPGGVIFLGMVEKAMFLAEYQNINNSGQVVWICLILNLDFLILNFGFVLVTLHRRRRV